MMGDYLCNLTRGFLIGIANIVPGVSGGSMALALGIYERLLTAIGSFDLTLARNALATLAFRKAAFSRFRNDLIRVDALFLCFIGVGVLAAVAMFSAIIQWLLQHWHAPTYGFFSGLILVSIIIPMRMIRRFSWKEALAVFLALVLTVGLAVAPDSQGRLEDVHKKHAIKQAKVLEDGFPENTRTIPAKPASALVYLFMCGAMAISAMVLPGVSGSFVLILMGAYFDMLRAVNQLDWVALFVFATGCGVGLLGFTRLLNWVLSRFHDVTIAFLTGLMSGSLVGLWPFREFEIIGDQAADWDRVDLGWLWPPLDANGLIALAAFLAGATVVWVSLRAANNRQAQGKDASSGP